MTYLEVPEDVTANLLANGEGTKCTKKKTSESYQGESRKARENRNRAKNPQWRIEKKEQPWWQITGGCCAGV